MVYLGVRRWRIPGACEGSEKKGNLRCLLYRPLLPGGAAVVWRFGSR